MHQNIHVANARRKQRSNGSSHFWSEPRASVLHHRADKPKSLREALGGPDTDFWKATISNEIMNFFDAMHGRKYQCPRYKIRNASWYLPRQYSKSNTNRVQI